MADAQTADTTQQVTSQIPVASQKNPKRVLQAKPSLRKGGWHARRRPKK